MHTTAHFSLAQYERMIDAGVFAGKFRQHIEFIRGEIVQMSPIGVRHAAIVDLINELSKVLFAPGEVIVRIQATLRIPDSESAPEPDIQWLRPRDYFQGHPEPDDVFLVIEVAESSVEGDTLEKAQLYAEAGIADYWVVNIDGDGVEVFRDPRPAGYASRQTLRGDEELRPLAFPEIAVRPEMLLGRKQ